MLNMERPGRKTWSDHLLVAVVVALAGTGLVTLFSASDAYAKLVTELVRTAENGAVRNRLTFFEEQLIHAAIGTVCFIIASFLPLRTVRLLVPCAVITAVFLCLCTFIPGVREVRNGAARWIHFGPLSFQPSEFVKLVVPLYLAHILDKRRDELDSFARGLLQPALVLALFFLLVCMQNNLSTALFITLNGLLVFFLAGVRIRYFAASLVIIAPVTGIFVLTRPHGMVRLLSWFWPDQDPLGAAYQINASILSVASGGIWGKGLGRGTRKLSSVPEIHSDFIFSAYTEELGFAGVLLFFLLFLVFAVRGYRAALRCEDSFRRLLGTSLVTLIVTQALINIAVVAGALPVTGMPLPFFSHGGSSFAVTLAMTGLLVNISRNPGAARFEGTGGEAFYVI